MKTGLTAFLIGMMGTPTAVLARADIAKLAAKYAIKSEWAEFYVSDWIGRK